MALPKSFLSLVVLALLAGCTQNQDPAKTRQEAAQAAAKAKEEGKQAAVELKKDTAEARRQGKAIAEGVKDGLSGNTTSASGSKKVNVNTASKDQLMSLPGMDDEQAQRVIDGRPYHTREELKAKGAVSPEEYQKIARQVATQ